MCQKFFIISCGLFIFAVIFTYKYCIISVVPVNEIASAYHLNISNVGNKF